LIGGDEAEFVFEAPSELLVIIGVDKAGDDPGLPVIDEYCPGMVLDPPYTGGWAEVVEATTGVLGAV